jgi:hypothetical protein
MARDAIAFVDALEIDRVDLGLVTHWGHPSGL